MDHRNNAKRASRRTFTKSIATAVAALPLVSTITARELHKDRFEGEQDASVKKAKQVRTLLSEHNTPPPILFMEGSLILEHHKDFVNDIGPGTTNYKLTTPETGSDIFFAHLKIVDGSGEMLFRFDTDKTDPDRKKIEITLFPSEAGKQVVVSTLRRDVRIKVPNGKKLDRKANDPAMSGKRNRARYMNSGGAEDALSAVRVTKGGTLLRNVILDDLDSKGEELKVMLWLEED